MKKTIPLILVLLLLFSACGGSGSEPESTDGTGETVLTDPSETYSNEGPEGFLEEKETETVYKIVKMTVMNEDGTLRWYREYVYDETGFCTEEYETNSNGEMTYRRANTADGNGYPLESQISEFGGRNYTMKFTCDDQGRILREETWENGVLTEAVEYTYDSHGNYLTLLQYWGEELVMDYSFFYTYDADGRQTGMDEYLFGDLMYHLEMTYDHQGRELATVTTAGTGEIQSRTESTWDGYTQTRSYFSGSDTEAYMVSIVTYDEAGNVVFDQTMYDDSVTGTAEYIYEPFEVKK